MTIPIRASESTLIEVRQSLQRIEQNRRTGVQNNFTATSAPGVGDDEADGYSAGSFWFDTVADILWLCTDATTGAAVWVNLFGSGEVAGTGHNFGVILPSDGDTVTAVSKKDALVVTGTGGLTVTGLDASTKITIDGAGASHTHDHTTDLTNVGTNTHAQLDSLAKLLQGTFLESFDALVIEDAGAVKMTLEQAGGGDLTMVFSDGFSTFDCTPIISTPLTQGADFSNPQRNYVYILQSAKILAVSTTGWPATEHVKVGLFFIQTDIEVAARGALINQNWNDHAADTAGADVGQGHLTHITERTRRLGAIWLSGCEGVATQDGNDLWVSIASGVVSQLHPHAFAALDSDTAGASDPILVVNDPDAAYVIVNSLNEITKRADGVAIGNNKYVKFVVWAVANKSGQLSPMMLNLPTDEYNSAAAAATDVQGYANFAIPAEFKLESTTGFLVAAFVCKHTASAMELQSTIDQRGQTPSTAIGGGTGGGDVTAAAVIVDNAIVRGDGGAKGVQSSSASIADDGVMSVPGIGDGGLTNYDLKVGNTADYGMIQFGNALLGRTSYNVGAIDLDGVVLVRNIGGPVTSEIEFMFAESVGNTCRFALPKSAVGNATYNPRSMLLAGPAPADTDFVKVSYWQTQGIFHNLTCDTAGSGSDLGVQNDLEVEGDIYTDSIKESTTAAGITLANDVHMGDNDILDVNNIRVNVGAAIHDAFGNTQLAWGFAVSAVNYITLFNSATGLPPSLVATGGDANVDLYLNPKGTGSVILAQNAVIGIGAAGVDYTLTFNGEDNSGVITFMEDEDRFDFGSAVNVGNLRLDGNTISTGSASIILQPALAGGVHTRVTGVEELDHIAWRIENYVWHAAMTNTRTSLGFHQAQTAGGLLSEAARITAGTEGNWTSTASTRDAYLAFFTGLDGIATEKVRINSAGMVGINTIDPGGNHASVFLDIRQDARCSFALYAHSNTASHDVRLFAGRARGTEASKVAVQDDDVLLLLQALGWSPSGAWRTAAYIKFDVDGTPATTTVPGAIGFWTTTTSSPSLRMTIQSDGDVLFDSGTSVFVRDSALGFNSSADGQLDLFADTEVEITTPLIDLNAANIFAATMASGTDQTDAGAAAGELYVDTNDDNTVKRGV